MRRAPLQRRVSVLLALAILGPVPLRAEVSGRSGGAILAGSVVDDPDPIGCQAWRPFGPDAEGSRLNPTGYWRGDAGPDIAFAAVAGTAVATWAYKTGEGHDVAFAEWTGTDWSAIEFVADTAADELDPRVFLEDDGTVHVTWWEPGPVDRVLLATRAAGSTTWAAPVQVSGLLEPGRRPSAAVLDGTLRVAWERPSALPEAGADVVVSRREPGGAFVIEHVAPAVWRDRLDPVLHVEGGLLWLDWKHDEEQLAWAVGSGSGWSAPTPAPWTDPTWIGVESARRTIRRQLLHP